MLALVLFLPATVAAQEEYDPDFSSDLSRTSRDVPEVPDGTRLRIDFEDTPLREVVNFFARQWRVNFIIGEPLSGNLTIFSPVPVTKNEAWQAFLSAMDSAGYTLIREGYTPGNRPIYRIVANSTAIRNPIELLDRDDRVPISARMVTRIVTVQNVSVGDIQGAISGLLGPDGNIIAYAPSNTLILTDSADNIRRVERIIQELDISSPQEEMRIHTLDFANASTVLEQIRTLFGVEDPVAQANARQQTEAQSAAARRRSARARARARRQQQEEAAAPASGSASGSTVGSQPTSISKIMADERTNSIIVMATPRAHERIEEFLERIDYEVDPTLQSDIHVIYLEHADAEELSQTLSNLVQDTSRSSQNDSRNTRTTRAAAARAQQAEGGATAAGNRTQRTGSGTADFQSGVRITADAPTNSLVITASRDDFLKLRRVIDRLDIRRKQVFVETVIMEVSDSDTDDTGVSWHGGAVGTSDTAPTLLGARGAESLGGLLSATGLLEGVAMGLFSQTIPLSVPSLDGSSTAIEIPAFGVLLHALQRDSSTNVLSAPSIITLDNEEAEIEIGETIPFPGTVSSLGNLGSLAASTGLNLPSVSVNREDVGIILRITPRISESDFVTLEVYQEISEAKQASADSSLGPTTTKRSAETVVNVASNQTVVIGGLMSTTETVTEDKVPVLGDIPLLGFLFRSRTREVRKTNLLIFLTPHVIDGPADLEEIFRIKMLQRMEFMQRFYGRGISEQAQELERLLRFAMNLPDQPSLYGPRESERIRYDEEISLSGPSSATTPYTFRPQPEEPAPEGYETIVTETGEQFLLGPDGDYYYVNEFNELERVTIGGEDDNGYEEGYEDALDDLEWDESQDEGDTPDDVGGPDSDLPENGADDGGSDEGETYIDGERMADEEGSSDEAPLIVIDRTDGAE